MQGCSEFCQIQVTLAKLIKFERQRVRKFCREVGSQDHFHRLRLLLSYVLLILDIRIPHIYSFAIIAICNFPWAPGTCTRAQFTAALAYHERCRGLPGATMPQARLENGRGVAYAPPVAAAGRS